MSDPRLKQIEWANREAVAVGLECLIELTLRHQNFAIPLYATDRLPPRIAAVGHGLPNSAALAA